MNDAAERAVKFASDFNGKITRSDKQHAGMLQGIDQNREVQSNALCHNAILNLYCSELVYIHK